MAELTFDILKTAWNRLKKERRRDLMRVVPDLSEPEEIYIKRIGEDDTELAVRFSGFRSATHDQNAIPQIKRVILTWLKNMAVSVQQARSDENTLVVRITKDTKFNEAAISVFKRSPKTNKKTTYYKCIGGKKDGRRVSDPNQCIGIPDPTKRIKFSITKRAKAGQAARSKKKTQLTNISARRIRKANQRLKKARGF